MKVGKMFRDISGFLVWCIVAAVGVILFVGILMAANPGFLALERWSVVNSNSYVQSRQGELLRLQKEYNRLEILAIDAKNRQDVPSEQTYRAQQRTVVLQMENIAATMNPSDIPAGVMIR